VFKLTTLSIDKSIMLRCQLFDSLFNVEQLWNDIDSVNEKY
jgi:hypothetical protein